MKHTHQTKLIAETCLGIVAIVTGFLSIYDISIGDRSGWQLLLSIPFFLLLMWLGWLQPAETGVGLIVLGVFTIAFLGYRMFFPVSLMASAGLILCSGIMFLFAYRAQKNQPQDI